MKFLRFYGEAKIENYKKDGNNMTAKIEVLKNKTVLELPYIYYSGYRVTLDGSEIPVFESENGFLEIRLNTLTSSDLKVEYTKNTGVKIFSVISFILFIFYNVTDVISNKSKTEKSLEN